MTSNKKSVTLSNSAEEVALVKTESNFSFSMDGASSSVTPNPRDSKATASSAATASTPVSGRPNARKVQEKQEKREKEQRRRQIRKEKLYITCCRSIVQNKFFITFTTILTIYALVGDDTRLLVTDKPADIVFNVMTIACIVIFFAEVILSCFGKDDYFMGFFFTLDIISTCTLIFDLTWVGEALHPDPESGEEADGGTAKIGARAARAVRVLRLVRILKLYKAIYEARMAQKRRAEMIEKMKRKGPGDAEDHWEDDFHTHATGQEVDVYQRKESRVGLKLSDLTTRRVIGLVLSMMAVLPLLQVGVEQQLPFAPEFGADISFDNFNRWQEAPSTTPKEILRKAYLHSQYVNSMLQMVYYHNWFTGHRSNCPNTETTCARSYDNYIFWVGVVTIENYPGLAQKANDLAFTAKEADAFVKVAENQNDIYNFGSFPPSVQEILRSPWTVKCDRADGSLKRIGFSLLKDKIPNGDSENPGVSYLVTCPEDLRRSERVKFSSRIMTKNEAKQWHVAFYFDKRGYSRQEAMFSLLITVFVCFVLCVASILFSADADTLVLHPLEQMISKVEKIRDNPMMAMKMSDEEFRQEQVRKAKEKFKEQNKYLQMKNKLMCVGKSEDQAEPMETVILEKTMIKIGSLLALGFGEAGANIIEHNMSGVDSAMVTAMVEGQRVECIIGCARIRDFSTATEVLRGNVMTFVNQIAEIVHGVVDELHGAANKNNGEHFLLIWRTSDLDDGYSSKLADMSMLAFTRILGAVHRSSLLAAYRFHPGLQMRLGKQCRVNCSFALHYGWAIEGAVGSEFKIDASYLSPNVSISESLEGATYIYGVNILISELVVSMCTPKMAAKCRLIDKVTLTGMEMELYCIDLDYRSLIVEPAIKCPPWNPRQRFRCRQYLEQEKMMKWADDVQIINFFNENSDVATMRFRYTLEFTHVFNMGYQNYSEGEWKVARRFLSLTRTMLGAEDGPSAALLRFMETPYKFEKPPKWVGVRDLGLDNLGH